MFSGDWTTAAPLPAPVIGAGYAVHDGKLWALGGFDDFFDRVDTVYSYDPNLDSWTTHDPLSTPIAPSGKAAYHDGKFYLMDWDGFYSYDPLTGVTASLAEPDAGFSDVQDLVEFGGKLYWALAFEDPEVYDPNLDSWSSITAAPDAVDIWSSMDASAVRGGDFIWVHYLGEVWRYDPTLDSWQTGFTTSTSELTITLSSEDSVWIDDRLVLLGGWTLDGAALAFDPQSDTWEELESIPSDGRLNAAAGEVAGRLVYAGGQTSIFTAADAVWFVMLAGDSLGTLDNEYHALSSTLTNAFTNAAVNAWLLNTYSNYAVRVTLSNAYRTGPVEARLTNSYNTIGAISVPPRALIRGEVQLE